MSSLNAAYVCDNVIKHEKKKKHTHERERERERERDLI